MFVRVAQFEGDPAELDKMVEGVRGDLQRGREGGSAPSGMDASAMEGLSGVTRVMLLVDRNAGKVANVVFTDSEDELNRADEALNSMSPQGSGRRTSVEKYELAIDQTMR